MRRRRPPRRSGRSPPRWRGSTTYAGGKGLRLGLEPANRYETYLVNTLDEAGAMIRSIGAKNIFVHMDTFHMNIEESDVAGAIARNADLLGYAHVADNTRGVLGAGEFDFHAFFRRWRAPATWAA